MANGTLVFLPPNASDTNQAIHWVHGNAVIQPPETIQYVQHGGQRLGAASNPSQQNPLEKFLKVEAKTIGTIQILIGLIHIGFGGLSLVLSQWNYFPLTAFAGYPFWGGVFFITSGSLSVSIQKNPTNVLVKTSVGMNITSAVMALTGLLLFSVEIAENTYSVYPEYYDWPITVGHGLCALLFLFSLLEFCITTSTAHFGCQATCRHSNTASI